MMRHKTSLLTLATMVAGLAFAGVASQAGSAATVSPDTMARIAASGLQNAGPGVEGEGLIKHVSHARSRRGYRRPHYSRRYHGPRYRYRRSGYPYFYGGYYYSVPWWTFGFAVTPAPRRHYGGNCNYWHNRCVANWGYRNADYYGCMRYHGC